MKARKSEVADHAKIFGPAVVLIILGFLFAYQFVDPAPPKHIVLATGGTQGAYHFFGQQYRDALAKEGITVELRTTAGSLENIELLRGGEADAAFVQGGTRPSDLPEDALLSLGSVFFEPLWVFVPGDQTITQITDLRGKRIAIGAEGSGTLSIAAAILAENRVTETESELLKWNGSQMADALVEGKIDAGFIVASPRSKTVQRLLNAPHITLMSFARADAYTRRHTFLSQVLLPEGVVDLDVNIPPRDITLIAPTANLVASPDIHPAIIDLLLQAASESHSAAGFFSDYGTFPSAKFLEFTLSDEAKRFFKSGPPFLQRFLPFWAATLIDRLLVMLLPLVALMVPLIRIMPPVFRWRIRSRIYRWYRELLEIDPLIHDEANIAHSLKALDRIENEVSKVEVPLSYADQLYHLRLHLELVREKLMARHTPPPPGE